MLVVTQITNMSLSTKHESLACIYDCYQQVGLPRSRHEAFEPTAADNPAQMPLIYDSAEVLPGLKSVWQASEKLCSMPLKAAQPKRLKHHGRRPLWEAFSQNP